MLHVEHKYFNLFKATLHVEHNFIDMVISGNIVDVVRRTIFKGRLYISDGKIADIQPCEDVNNVYILPGLIDSHVHVESSMVIPGRFAQTAVKHGVVAVVADPHEIANVCGVDGVRFMVEDASRVPFKFYFGAPSCVPATPFDSAGAALDVADVEYLFDVLKLKFLAEMMNFPGVIMKDQMVMKKLNTALERGLPIDGHAPMLTGDSLAEYIKAGIDTDHECTSLFEAEEKINLGMKIQIREGSASHNFDALYPLIDLYPDHVMLCSDDCHPETLEKKYLNRFIPIGREKGLDLWNILQALTINPVSHYKLDVGLLQKEDPADFIIVDNIHSMNILQTWIKGQLAFDGETSFSYNPPETMINKFLAKHLEVQAIGVKPLGEKINIIKCIDKQLYTEHLVDSPTIENGFCVSDPERDILKIVVINRYIDESKPAVGFITGFNLKEGAMASTVSHDSHNIVAVGCSDEDIINAINLLVDAKGGIAFSSGNSNNVLPLPVGGLMSCMETSEVARDYENIQKMVKESGCTLTAPFMTLAFMSLLVIPKIKISDKGLFDSEKFQFISNFCQ